MLRQRLLNLLAKIRVDADARELMRRFVATSDVKKWGAGPLHILAVGKAATGMYEGLVSAWPCRNAKVLVLRAKGKACKEHVHREFSQVVCDHPLPTERNIRGAQRVEKFVRSVPAEGSLLVLLSGGASAYLSLPDIGLDLNTLRGVTGDLQRSGATIDELNTVRKQIERLKGGKLGHMCAASNVRVAVLSDVLGDRIEVIGSGPFACNTTTAEDALEVLKRYGLRRKHRGVVAYLQHSGRSDVVQRITAIRHDVIGSNRTLVDAVAARCKSVKLVVHHVEQGCQGHAGKLGERIADCLKNGAFRSGVCIFGGEPTVNVENSRGIGGPSMEVALSVALKGAGQSGWALLAYSTDGRDGPTTGAGALVDGASLARMKSRGVDPLRALKEHDSFIAHQRAGTLIRNGPTGTNVNHIYVLLRE